VTDGDDNIHIASFGDPLDAQTIRIGNAQTSTFIAGIFLATVDPASAANVQIDGDGKLGTTASSRRMKTGIEPVGERSQGLHALRPVSFRYRTQPPDGPLQYGLIAEEVAEVYPELVVRDGDGAPWTVRYHLLPALLLSELQRQERALQEKERELKTQGDLLRAQQAELAALAAALAEVSSRLTHVESREPITGRSAWVPE
jgi:endosialidase-like protein